MINSIPIAAYGAKLRRWTLPLLLAIGLALLLTAGPAEAQTLGPLGDPTNLTAAPGSYAGEVSLRWTPAANATAHWVYYRDTALPSSLWTGVKVGGGNANAAEIVGLEIGPTYRFVVRAGQRQSDGTTTWSVWSTPADATAGRTSSGTRPTAPDSGAAPLPGQPARPGIYWTDSAKAQIWRANLNGSDPEPLVTSGLRDPAGLALDVSQGKMYWTDYGTSKIQRANLNGTGVEDLVTGLSYPTGLALDTSMGTGSIYWADSGTGKIQYASLDSPRTVQDLITGLDYPYGLAVDTSTRRIYWTDLDTGKIQYASLDSPHAVQDLATLGVRSPAGLALDAPARQVYWTDYGTDMIQRASLNDDGAVIKIEPLVTSGLERPAGIALDAAGNMYWTDYGTRKIQSASLAGNGVSDLVTSDLVTSGLDWPLGIAVTNPSAASLSAHVVLQSAPQLYWVDEAAQKIQRTGTDDAQEVAEPEVIELLTAEHQLDMPGSIALDLAAGKMYWTDDGAGAIRRANLDGSGAVENLKGGLADPVGIALDLDNGYLYWADRFHGAIYRSEENINQDGLQVSAKPLVARLDKPYQIALDTANGHMYWTERGEGTSKISRADLDGQNVTDITFTGLIAPLNPFGLTLDLVAGRMYWTERSSGGDAIVSANLDGQDGRILAHSEAYSLSGIAVDVATGKIYWTDEKTGAIRRTDPADPNSAVEVVVTGLSAPEGIAVARSPDAAALRALYEATRGNNWTNSNGWLSDAPIGEWHGVTTDNDGRVTSLRLGYNQLSGPMPPELGNLANLAYLDLEGNQLSGSIPPELGNLANLAYLDLEGNQLGGSIPPELADLGQLRRFDLSDNRLDWIEFDLGDLTALERINFSNNRLEGSIDDMAWANLGNLKELDLSDNRLDWIEFDLGDLTALERINFSNNRLEGSIDDMTWANLGNLKELDLSDNLLEWEIPGTLGELSRLERLDLGHNRLSGTIPAELGNLAELRTLYLDDQDRFRGNPPPNAFEQQAQYLDDNNYLHGQIPPELGNLAKLKELNLSNNRLSGEIPPELSYRSYICFHERYPEPIGSLANLRVLDLSDNALSGKIPVGLCGLKTLKFLDLGKNFLEGEIPPGLGYLTKLEELNLSNNQLEGAIPAQVVNLPFLSRLYLHGNGFSGCVEITAERANRLRLIIDNDGEPPTCKVVNALLHEKKREYAALQNLYRSTTGDDWTHGSNDPNKWRVHVDIIGKDITEDAFDYSQWYGVRVANVDGADRVVGLRLNDNNLQGKIPPELDKGLPYLEYLTLGGNPLDGCIPTGLSLALAVGEGFRDPKTEELDGENHEYGLTTELAIAAAEAGIEAAVEEFALDLGAGLLVDDADFKNNKAVQEGLKNAKEDLVERKKKVDEKIQVVTTITKAVVRVFQSSAIKLNVPVCAPPAPEPAIPGQGKSPTADTDQEILLAVKAHFVQQCEEILGKTTEECVNENKFGNWEENRPWNNGNIFERHWGGATIGNGRVTRLDLQSRNLQGPILEVLGGLDQLTYLNLSDNQLTGPIPPELGNLDKLGTLGLNNNRLSNTTINGDGKKIVTDPPIPPSLGNLVQLVEFNVQVNELEGWLPLELSMLTSHSLSQMDLDRDGEHVIEGCLPAYTWGTTEAAFALGDLGIDIATALVGTVGTGGLAAPAAAAKTIATVTKGARFIGATWKGATATVRSTKFVKFGTNLVETVKKSRFVKAHPYLAAGAFAGGKAFAEGVQEAMVESALEAYGGPVHSAWSGWVATIANISATEFLRDHLWPGKGAIIMGKVWCGDS